MLLVISCRPSDVLFILQTSAAWSVLTPIVRVSSGHLVGPVCCEFLVSGPPVCCEGELAQLEVSSL